MHYRVGCAPRLASGNRDFGEERERELLVVVAHGIFGIHLYSKCVKTRRGKITDGN